MDTSVRENVTLYVLPFASLPSAGLDGDIFFTSDTSQFYMGQGGGLPLVLIGPSVGGASLLSGAVDPTGTDGKNGDFWINTTSHYLFGPKASGTWPAGTPLVGPAGSSTLAGDTDVAITTPTNGQVLAYNSTASKWENSDAATALGYPSSGAVSISQGALPATLNVTTEGTKDWVSGNAVTSTTLGNSGHGKEGGGWLRDAFRWVSGGFTTTLGAVTFTGTAVSSNTGDDDASAPLASSNQGAQVTCSGASPVGIGFRLRVPADTFSRTLKIYAGIGAALGRLTVALSDGSATVTSDLDSVNNAGSPNTVFTVTYNSARDGQSAVITLLTVSFHTGASVPAVKFLAATLQ